MRKAITFILVLAQVLMLVGCSTRSEMNVYNESVINVNFEKTLENYYFMDGNSVAISLYSFSDKPSPIITLSLQNLLKKKNVNADKYSETNNAYYYSIIKSQYTNVNYIEINKLTNESSEYDYYMAFKTAKLLNDMDCVDVLKEKYRTYQPKDNTFSDKLYRAMNKKFSSGDKGTLDAEVSTYINKFAVDLRFDFDSMLDLHACLNYISTFDINVNSNDLEKIFKSLNTTENQKFMLSQSDIFTSQYMDILSMLNQYFPKVDLQESFFGKYEKENTECYEGVYYDVNSIKNFALYVTGLYFAKETISEELYEELVNITKQFKPSEYNKDAMSVFYYNYLCKKLNIEDKVLSGDNKIDKSADITSIYYQLKNEDETLEKASIDKYDLLAKLLYLDVCNDKEYIVKCLDEIDIWLNKDTKEFPIILNLYTSILEKHKIVTNKEKDQIKAYLDEKKNIYGYSGLANNYDLEASSYYTNVINILESGEDSGIR